MMTETGDNILVFSGFRLEPERRRLTAPDGHALTLRTKEFDTLLALVRRAGTVVTKDELMAAVWPGAVVEENNLNQAISKLRQALGDDHHNPNFIATLPGRGYQFIAPVTRLAADSPAASDGPAPKSALRWYRVIATAVAVLVIAVVIARLTMTDAPPPTPATISLDAAELVTEAPASYSMPTLSADGTFMAYVSDRSGTSQVWIQGLPDGKPLQVTHGDVPAVSPTWSPVDDTILFQRAGTDGAQSIWMTDALSSNPPQLIVRGGRSPRFVDGDSFTFIRGVNEIHVGNLKDNETRRLDIVPATPGFADPDPAINAQGDIAFVLADEGPSGNLWLYDASTSTARPLTRSANDFAGVWARSPVWTADGDSIIYVAADGDPNNTHLWQANTLTGQVQRLSAGVGGYQDVAISADGSRLTYTYVRPLSRLVRSDFATGERQTVVERRDSIALPAVSADGLSIVYFFDNVYTVPVAGGEPNQLTFREPGQATLPAWSRSEKLIYYYNGRTLHRLDPQTGSSDLVLEDFHWSSKNWLAVHDSTIAYSLRNAAPGTKRTVILNLETGDERRLDEPLDPTDFSRDGRYLLGSRHDDAVLMICQAPGFDCQPLLDGDVPVVGAIPRWSADESRVFFRRAHDSGPDYASIWVVPREGGEATRLGEVGPFVRDNMFFGVAADDTIIWNEYDARASSEVWITDIR